MGSTAREPALTDPSGAPFWNTNLPSSQHTQACPPYLTYAFKDLRDQRILATPDSAYKPQTWPELCSLIADNRIDLLQRLPSDLHKYRKYNAQLVERYGSIMAFIVQERLAWDSLEPKGSPFEHLEEDTKILKNDWPYGLEAGIVHLVVWTKFALPEDADTWDLTREMRAKIDGFVEERFVRQGGIERDRVRWFRNWSAIKSVHAVEHFHVMLRDPPKYFVDEVTGGDMALVEKVA